MVSIRSCILNEKPVRFEEDSMAMAAIRSIVSVLLVLLVPAHAPAEEKAPVTPGDAAPKAPAEWTARMTIAT